MSENQGGNRPPQRRKSKTREPSKKRKGASSFEDLPMPQVFLLRRRKTRVVEARASDTRGGE